MKIFLYADEDNNMRFNAEIAREYILEIIGDAEPQRTRVMNIKNSKELAKHFFTAAILVAQDERAIEIFKHGKFST